MPRPGSPPRIGIVGHEAAKFTPEGEAQARRIIRELLTPEGAVCVSGACHLGGVDVWAAEEARAMGREVREYPPKRRTWSGGYKDRNLQIANDADEVHCIVVDALPTSYHGMRFEVCYHCGSRDHVKSGGCWTRKQAEALGKSGYTHVVKQSESGP